MQVKFLPFFVRHIVRDLHANLGVVDAYEKIQKIAQIGFVHNGAFDQVLPGLS